MPDHLTRSTHSIPCPWHSVCIRVCVCMSVCVRLLYITTCLGPSKGVTVTRCCRLHVSNHSHGACCSSSSLPLQVFALEQEGLSGREEQGGPYCKLTPLLSLHTLIAHFCPFTSFFPLADHYQGTLTFMCTCC